MLGMMAALAGAMGRQAQPAHAAAATVVASAPTTAPLADKPLPSYQVELLELAMQTASAIPVEPHIKDRSRAQESVVAACLQLDQPERAEQYLEAIKDWRRGAAYADLAIYLARRQRGTEIQPLLDKAMKIAQAANLEEWRRDRIKVKVATAYVLIGQRAQAEELVKIVEPSESGKLTGVVDSAAPDDYEARLKQIREHIAKGVYDLTVNALESSIRIYARHYANVDRRAEIEKLVHDSWQPLPLHVRIDLLLKLGQVALEYQDQVKAVALVNEAEEIFGGARWRLEYQLPLIARLAEFRYRAGDVDKARAALQAAWALFTENKAQIVDIDRAQAILPLGRAFMVMKDKAAALDVYRGAATEGAINPNARPRALDLTAICCDLAVQGIEPDKDLWERLHQLRRGLVQPW